MSDEEARTTISRRRMLKRIGAGTAVAWTAPVILSLRTSAYAASQPGCIRMPNAGTVTAEVIFKGALHTLEFGLESPDHVVVCADCQGGESVSLGPYPAGTSLLFYLHDHGGVCDGGCDVTYLCTDSCHSTVTQTGPNTYEVGFKDSGCGCGGYPCDFPNGNLVAGITLP